MRHDSTTYEGWLGELAAMSNRRVFFVLGCQKSGTTWVQRLLNAHARICCGAEGHVPDLLMPLLAQGVKLYNERQGKRAKSGLGVLLDDRTLLWTCRTMLDTVMRTYLAEEGRQDRIEAIGDKTPEYALHMPMLAQLYPQARFIHVIRDGRDAAVSGWWHLQRTIDTNPEAAASFRTFADYAEYFAARHWVGYINTARTAAEGLSERYMEVRYEDLHGRPDEELRRMLHLLDIEPHDDEMATAVAGGSFRTLSGGRDRGQEDRGKFFRKGITGEWQEMFDSSALARFQSHAGPLLSKLGYAEQAIPASEAAF